MFQSMRLQRFLGRLIIYILLTVVCFLAFLPFLWMVLTAFKTQAESTSIDPFVFLPSSWSFESFTTV